MPLPAEFYAVDPLELARNLLGVRLVCEGADGVARSGIIVETEAYRGEEDQACHARAGRTKRTAVLYGPAGIAYVYLIYGMYDMFNVTAWPEGQPAAVLVRGIEPIGDLGRRTDGPGRLTRALGIDRSHDGLPLDRAPIYLTEGRAIADEDVATSPRIGIDYAGEWAARPWRFYVVGSAHVSRPR